MFKTFSKLKVAGKTFEVKDATARGSVVAVKRELCVIHDNVNKVTDEVSEITNQITTIESEINEKVLNVTIESDGFGSFIANYNDNDINNFRNNGGLVQAKYDTGNETYTYYYSTMESDRRPAFVRTYIENGIGKQVIIRVGFDKKVEVETRVTTSIGVSKEYVDSQDKIIKDEVDKIDTLTTKLPVVNGGTGATTVEDALINLGLDKSRLIEEGTNDDQIWYKYSNGLQIIMGTMVATVQFTAWDGLSSTDYLNLGEFARPFIYAPGIFITPVPSGGAWFLNSIGLTTGTNAGTVALSRGSVSAGYTTTVKAFWLAIGRWK